MKLSDGEKLILLMLSDIHEQLKVRGEVDARFVKETLVNDHLWGFRWQFNSLGLSPDDDPAEVTETVDILEMYQFIIRGFSELSKAEKTRVRKSVRHHVEDLEEFPGFDGNHDPHKSIARYLIDQLERFTELKGGKNNSHSRGSLPRYRRMLTIFKPIMKGLGSNELSADEIIKILA